MGASSKQNQGGELSRAAQNHKQEFGAAVGAGVFDYAIRALIPDNDTRKVLALFQGRASRQAVQHWRHDTRRPPIWALDTIARALEHKAQIAQRVRLLTPSTQRAAGTRNLARGRAYQFQTKEKTSS